MNWFNLSVDETLKELETNVDNGLTIEEVKKRKKKYGLN